VNLYLRVVRRREDGFHELETVFQSVGGGDTLTAAPAAELTLRCSEPDIPSDERNLVLRAAKLLRNAFPGAPKQGAALALLKRTPAGGGMGGGSVDGAAALVLLSRLWELRPTSEQLAGMAATLGSDVPFFLLGGAALARGRGEVLEPVAVPARRFWLVLVKPPVSVSTPWAFGRWRAEETGEPGVQEFLAAYQSGDPAALVDVLRNDLEPGVAAGVPEIAAARRWLLSNGALGARMTGSGSVVFGVARDEAHARELAAHGTAPGQAWAVPFLTAAEAALRPVQCASSDPPAP
jgi:4-diphosphocytidyl-2-C-methyl-D-erythritol kinase